MVLNCNEIMDIIPHRSPFLLVDRILELVPGIRAIGRKCVTFNEPFFTGHYPGNPVMPGVLIIEALAQVGSVVMLSLEENKGKVPFFGGIDKAKFRNMVTPGDVLTLEVSLLKQKGPVGVATAKAYDDEKVFAEAELTFVIR
ncbi:3-hydroxyacyl-ACP dehydratase FabZ [Lachnoclostridium phytofermentans]|uniref:3-hydroxyacyl-[acyl-carrier-protein] dehydratase FabZ n=1 Tax=Lachnoclostridium phytofermentans (strain ATCC 700394 / DSM 18823 / ISDg) TaxID=357809 RepID=A9KI73_LACP7|nr:3-hydroxyacyl-ACP dehydratase FabZ [Lachnoclostridium phytofermentans]ABX40907.1 beta-hydroxyacyl-(acyl-carrier-protein) dehydratase FabZ [Lachnoclostridium phytofermentans ISDg]